MTSGVPLLEMPTFFPLYKIVAISCKEKLNSVVAYGDFAVMLCFYCNFQCVCFSMGKNSVTVCHQDHIKMRSCPAVMLRP